MPDLLAQGKGGCPRVDNEEPYAISTACAGAFKLC